MKDIVILGGCGYIGSRLYLHLRKRRFSVDTVDTELFGNYINPNNIQCDYSELPANFFSKYNTVILLAGHSTVGMCDDDKIGALKNNIENFAGLLSKLKKQKLIYASTYRIYDGISGHPVNETENFQEPSSLYTLTKKTIDYYASLTDIEFYSLRMATVNGFSPNLRTNQIINKLFLESKKKKAITIYDPEKIFTVLGIGDLCRAIESIIQKADRRGIYNLGSFNTSIHEIIKALLEVQKFSVQIPAGHDNRYHMQIGTEKFQHAYKFTFSETIRSIIFDLQQNVSDSTHFLKSK